MLLNHIARISKLMNTLKAIKTGENQPIKISKKTVMMTVKYGIRVPY